MFFRMSPGSAAETSESWTKKQENNNKEINIRL